MRKYLLNSEAIGKITKAQSDGFLVEFAIQRSADTTTGFVVEITSQWLVLLEFDWNHFAVGYYCILNRDCISQFQVFEESDWVSEAMKLLGVQRVVTPKRSRRSLLSLLKRYNQGVPVVEIEREANYPGELFLCIVKQAKGTSVSVRCFDRDLVKTDVEIKTKEISKVSVATGYCRGISRVLVARGHMCAVGKSAEADYGIALG